MRTDFIRSEISEPHVLRRKKILDAHPEIRDLFGYDMRPIPFVLMIIASQLTIAYYQQTWSFWLFFIVAYIYGGVASHSLSLMTHECSHNLILPKPDHNEYFGIFCNIAMGVPSSAMFKRYHMEHHQYQGDVVKDVDVPTVLEGNLVTNSFLKAVWMLCQPLFYAFRPMIIRPKSPKRMDMLNTFIIVVSDCVVVYFCGLRGLLYLVLSTLLGMGLHPVAGHFIAEHYVFNNDVNVETYSYYGALNYLCWNVGYHNEHQ